MSTDLPASDPISVDFDNRGAVMATNEPSSSSSAANATTTIDGVDGSGNNPNPDEEQRQQQQQDDNDTCCPICLGAYDGHNNKTMARSGSCGHSFCTDCLRQYFALSTTIPSPLPPVPSGVSSSMEEDKTEDPNECYYSLSVEELQDCNIDGIATLKGCPLCRSPMNLLELKYTNTSLSTAATPSVWCDVGSGDEQQHLQSKFESTPLAGRIYSTRRGIGYNSFHFPPYPDSNTNNNTSHTKNDENDGGDDDDDGKNNDDNKLNLPYFLWEEDDDAKKLLLLSTTTSNTTATNAASSTNTSETYSGSSPSSRNEETDGQHEQEQEQQQEAGNATATTTRSAATKYYFQPGCFYFAPKRSFHGKVLLPTGTGYDYGTLQQHDVILDYAANHKWITGGLMFRSSNSNSPSSSRSTNSHPLEGRWKVTWYKKIMSHDDGDAKEEDEDNIIDTAHINVFDNCAIDAQSVVYRLRYHLTDDHERDTKDEQKDEGSKVMMASAISFYWPGYGVTQTLVRHTNNDDDDNNNRMPIPGVGDCLKWTTTDPGQPYIVWKRETVVDYNDDSTAATTKPNITYFGRSGDRNNTSTNGGGGAGDPLFFAQQQRNTSETWYREWRPTNAYDRNSIVSGGGGIHDTDNSTLELQQRSQQQQQQHPERPPYLSSQLWGNSFCQGLRVGLASYHFGMNNNSGNNNSGNHEDGENDEAAAAAADTGNPFAYISYENDMCSQWPPLDDGSPIPPQVYFHNISLERIDPDAAADSNENRTAAAAAAAAHYVFRGTIEWLEDFGSSWQNTDFWEYEMHFDSQFTCIVSGTVHMIAASQPGNDEADDGNNQRRRRRTSHYGSDLVYVNAGIVNAFDEWMNDDSLFNDNNNAADSSSDDDVYPRYTHISRSLRRRLQAEGASVRTVAMLNMIFTHSLQPGNDSPIDYNT